MGLRISLRSGVSSGDCRAAAQARLRLRRIIIGSNATSRQLCGHAPVFLAHKLRLLVSYMPLARLAFPAVFLGALGPRPRGGDEANLVSLFRTVY